MLLDDAGAAPLIDRLLEIVIDTAPLWPIGAPDLQFRRERLQRDANQSPVAYVSGTTYYLMNRGGEWVIVAWESWVT